MKLAELAPCLEYPHMSVRHLAILLLLAQEEKIKLRDVSLALNVPRPSVSRAWSGLFAMKLMHRERSEEDARDVFGVLTEKGREFAQRIGG